MVYGHIAACMYLYANDLCFLLLRTVIPSGDSETRDSGAADSRSGIIMGGSCSMCWPWVSY